MSKTLHLVSLGVVLALLLLYPSSPRQDRLPRDRAADSKSALPELLPPAGPHHSAVIHFDPLQSCFVLKNRGRQTVWFYGYSSTYPMHVEQRKTRAGWMTTFYHWCGTGAGLHALEPGKCVNIRPRLSIESYTVALGQPDLIQTFPDIGKAPFRVSIHIYSRSDLNASSEEIASPAVDLPVKTSGSIIG